MDRSVRFLADEELYLASRLVVFLVISSSSRHTIEEKQDTAWYQYPPDQIENTPQGLPPRRGKS